MMIYATGHKAQPQATAEAPTSQPSSPQQAKSQPIDVCVGSAQSQGCRSCASSLSSSPQPQFVVPPPPSAQEMARRQKETNKTMFWASTL